VATGTTGAAGPAGAAGSIGAAPIVAGDGGPGPAPPVQSRRLLGVARTAVVAVGTVLLGAQLAVGVLTVTGAPALPEVAFAPWTSPDGRAVLAAWGVDVRWWAVGYVAVAFATTAVSAVAAWLVLRGEPSPYRLHLGLSLVLFGTLGSELALVADALFPQAGGLGRRLQGLGIVPLFLAAYVFPDGRFVPSWARWPFAGWLVLLAAASLVDDDGRAAGWSPAEDVAIMLLFGSCVAAQVYRYVRVSGPVERLQARWLLAAVMAWFVLAVVLIATPLRSLIHEASPAGLASYAVVLPLSSAVLALVPAAIAAAVLRYRLFEIDLWVSRTVVHGVLTAFVVVVYALVVGGVGSLWPIGDPALSVLAAALVALAFAPVRAVVQTRVERLVLGERGDPYRALARLGDRLRGTLLPEDVAPALVDAVREALRVPCAAVSVPDGTGERLLARSGRSGTPVDGVDLTHRGEYVGRLLVGRRSPGERFAAADLRLLADLAGHCGTALYAARESDRLRMLAADLQRARTQLVTAREEERRRLRRDLHDSLGPALSGQMMVIGAARSLLETDPAAADRLLGDLGGLCGQALDEVRRLARELRPPALDDAGLAAALDQAAEPHRRQGLEVRVDVADLSSSPAAVQSAVYRIAVEAMTNVARHAGATCCAVTVRHRGDGLDLEITDDGRGPAPDAGAGVGTASMRERAEELGGWCEMRPGAAAGTVVLARLPLPRDGDGSAK